MQVSGSKVLMGVGHIDISCYQSATATKTQDPNNETGCTPAVLPFVQSHPDKLVRHKPLMDQVYTTKSSIADMTKLPRATFPRVGHDSMTDMQGASN